MDFKDFKKMINDALNKKAKKGISTYFARQRQSRPRVKKNILRDE
jgi:hypothetical protein